MSLIIKLQQDAKEAQLNKDENTLSVLRFLMASIHNKEIEKRTKLSKTESIEKLEELSKLTDEEIIDTVASEIKKRKESILQFEKGNRQDLAEKEKKELTILAQYLPEQLPEDQVRQIIKEAVQKVGAKEMKDMGKVMAEIMPKLKGKADNGIIAQIVKEFIS